MAHFLEKIFGSFNDKEVNKLMKRVKEIEKDVYKRQGCIIPYPFFGQRRKLPLG